MNINVNKIKRYQTKIYTVCQKDDKIHLNHLPGVFFLLLMHTKNIK